VAPVARPEHVQHGRNRVAYGEHVLLPLERQLRGVKGLMERRLY